MDINAIAKQLGQQTAEYLRKKSSKVELKSGGITAKDGRGGEVFVRYPNVPKTSGRSVKR
ncbi:MAG: hypothetical protein ACRC62_32240 [Microcoleus sp.]